MRRPAVHIVSGGIGACGEQLARTTLAQFPDVEVEVVVIPHVRTVGDLETAVARAAARGGLIIHTLVDNDLRQQIEVLARARGVRAIDAIGPLLEQLSLLVGKEALGSPGLYRRLREDYFRRIEAIEYAVAHDDGRNPHELDLADVVLTGVSRVGKTPLCMYLAMSGWRAANVPLVAGIEPPRQLFEIDRRRVVGLTILPERLQSHRRRRQRTLGAVGALAYSRAREITEELEFAREVFRRGRFTTVDISDKPIEESAGEVVAHLDRG